MWQHQEGNVADMSIEVFMAQEKFLSTPELVSYLLPFLNLKSILSLAEAHDFTRAILQKSFNWDKLVRRYCPSHHQYDHFDMQSDPDAEEKIGHVKGLVAILKLMAKPKVLLPNLLDVICERFSHREDSIAAPSNYPVSLTCPCHPDGHNVSLLGFVLLEEAEGAFGTALQELVSTSRGGNGLPLSALASRLNRQATVARINFEGVNIFDIKDVRGLVSLLQADPEFGRPIALSVCGKGDINEHRETGEGYEGTFDEWGRAWVKEQDLETLGHVGWGPKLKNHPIFI